MNLVPTDAEIKAADSRREAYYRQCFAEANELSRSNPRKLADVLTQDHHLAAEMFGQETTWHINVKAKMDCPKCGEKINEGVSHHFVQGHPCILDWESAWLAGVIKKEDVPEPMQWWHDEKRGPGRPRKVQEEV